MLVKSYIYGSCIPNPNGIAVARCAIVIPDSTIKIVTLPRIYAVAGSVEASIKTDKDLTQLSWVKTVGVGAGMTNYVANYEAMFSTLVQLQKLGLRLHPNIILTESLILVNQAAGVYTSNRGSYIPYYQKAISMLKQFPYLKVSMVHKDYNIARLCKPLTSD